LRKCIYIVDRIIIIIFLPHQEVFLFDYASYKILFIQNAREIIMT